MSFIHQSLKYWKIYSLGDLEYGPIPNSYSKVVPEWGRVGVGRGVGAGKLSTKTDGLFLLFPPWETKAMAKTIYNPYFPTTNPCTGRRASEWLWLTKKHIQQLPPESRKEHELWVFYSWLLWFLPFFMLLNKRQCHLSLTHTPTYVLQQRNLCICHFDKKKTLLPLLQSVFLLMVGGSARCHGCEWAYLAELQGESEKSINQVTVI